MRALLVREGFWAFDVPVVHVVCLAAVGLDAGCFICCCAAASGVLLV